MAIPKTEDAFGRILEKIEKQIKEINPPASKTLLITCLGGSFSPVHKMHLQLIEEARFILEQEKPAFVNIFGLMVASTDEYLRCKLKQEAIGGDHRIQMIEKACEEKPWIDVYGKMDLNAEYVGEKLLKLVRQKWKEYCWRAIPIYGADSVSKAQIFRWQSDFVCVGREGYSTELKQQVAEWLLFSENSAEGELGFVMTETVLPPISSTKVRILLREQNWKELETCVNPQVLEYLKEHLDSLFVREVRLSPKASYCETDVWDIRRGDLTVGEFLDYLSERYEVSVASASGSGKKFYDYQRSPTENSLDQKISAVLGLSHFDLHFKTIPLAVYFLHPEQGTRIKGPQIHLSFRLPLGNSSFKN